MAAVAAAPAAMAGGAITPAGEDAGQPGAARRQHVVAVVADHHRPPPRRRRPARRVPAGGPDRACARGSCRRRRPRRNGRRGRARRAAPRSPPPACWCRPPGASRPRPARQRCGDAGEQRRRLGRAGGVVGGERGQQRLGEGQSAAPAAARSTSDADAVADHRGDLRPGEAGPGRWPPSGGRGRRGGRARCRPACRRGRRRRGGDGAALHGSAYRAPTAIERCAVLALTGQAGHNRIRCCRGGRIGPRRARFRRCYARRRHHPRRRSRHPHAERAAQGAAPVAGRPMLQPSDQRLRAGVRPHRRGGRAGHAARWSGRPRRMRRWCRRSGSAPAHAALQAAPLLRDFDGDVAVLYADNPLITAGHPAAAAGARRQPRPGWRCWRCGRRIRARYGRVVTEPPAMSTRIVEWADATEAERAIGLCNAGVVCAPAADLFRWLRRGAARQCQGRILPDRHRRPGGRRGPPGGGGGGAPRRNWPASTAGPSWPLLEAGDAGAGCARRRWRAARR